MPRFGSQPLIKTYSRA